MDEKISTTAPNKLMRAEKVERFKHFQAIYEIIQSEVIS
jgi:hypothetical protein